MTRLTQDLAQPEPGPAEPDAGQISIFLKIPEVHQKSQMWGGLTLVRAQNRSRRSQNEFEVSTEGQKATFQREPKMDAWSSSLVRSRPILLPSLEVETDLVHEL